MDPSTNNESHGEPEEAPDSVDAESDGDAAAERPAPGSSQDGSSVGEADVGAETQSARAGRWAGRAVHIAALVALAVVVTIQVTWQVFFPDAPDEPPPFSTCRQGLRELYSAIERGREAAGRAGQPQSPTTSEAALRRYREAVEPIWRHRDAVATLCRSNPQHQATLDAIERLRYAEEHGARNQAAELASLRRRVRKTVEQSLHTE